MEILPKNEKFKMQPVNIFKMAYLVKMNFELVNGPSSEILDIRLIHGNMHFIYATFT